MRVASLITEFGHRSRHKLIPAKRKLQAAKGVKRSDLDSLSSPHTIV